MRSASQTSDVEGGMKLTIGLILLFLIGLMAIAGPWLSPYSYYETNLAGKNLGPSLAHWFGTDDLGRDVLTRVCFGARISLFVGVAAALIDMVIGVMWGGIAAYYGGLVDEVMMGIADILYALPYLLVVIIISMVLGEGILSLLAAMTFIGWITMARIVRGRMMQLMGQEFMLAGRAMGLGHRRLFFGHLLPNAWESIIVTMTATIPAAIFTEAFLSFLGLGVQAPIASWGTMASEGLPALSFYPWRLLIPSFFLCVAMLGFH